MSNSELEPRELRVAPVMTGGTSLSVWMGGATVELYTMLREGQAGSASPGSEGSIYARLCALTRTTPVVDVITGTSAGGLNGTLLATGVAYRVPRDTFAELRTTWMTVADITALMRDGDTTPQSLLDGQKKFRDKVEEIIAGWRAAADPAALQHPDYVDLVTTFTSIQPRDHVAVDDFGEEMSEVQYAGTLRFTSDDFVETGEQPGVVAKLAHAAKASASLPGVFEPSLLSWWADDPGPYEPPNLYRNLVTKTPSGTEYVVDGGVVVNMPLTEALDRIYSRPSDALVRRVVLYVSPTPKVPIRTRADSRHAYCIDPQPAPTPARGTAPDAASTLAALAVPKLREAVATIVTAPRAEGISNDLSDIERHNRDVRRQRSTRSTLGWLLSDGNDPLAPGTTTRAERELMDLYRAARAEDSIESLLERLRPVVGAKIPQDPKLVRESLVRVRREKLPTTLPLGPLDGAVWQWGVAPVEESVSMVASIINRLMGLPLTAPLGRLGDADLASTHRELRRAKATLQQVSEDCREIRRYDDTFWALRLDELGGRDDDQVDVEQFARSGFEVWPTLAPGDGGVDPAVTREQVLQRLRAGFLTVAEVVHKIHPLVVPLLAAAGASGSDTATSLRDETHQEAVALARELAAIRFDGDLELICWGLLRLHVVQTVMIGQLQRREHRVEMLQVSWNTPDYVTGRQPQEKLVGPELARLGAFLKPSWRASDYFWGRMDAAPRLLELLADPRRLVQLGVSSAELCEQLGVTPDQELAEELAFLDSVDRSIPHRLPLLVEVLARRRQLEIARDELPHIAATIGARHTTRHLAVAVPEQARRFQAAARTLHQQSSDADVERVLCAMRVGEESLASEAGSPLLKYVVTNASSLALDAVLAPSSGLRLPAFVSRGLRVGRRPLVGLVGQRLVRKFNRGDPPATYTCRASCPPPG